jgi:hypothetical protein
MRTPPRFVVAAVAALLAIPAHAGEPTSDPEAMRLGAELDAAEAATHVKRDPAEVERIWSEAFIVTNLFGTVLTRSEALDRVRKGLIRFTAMTRTVEHARRSGDGLVTIGREELTGSAGSVVPPGKTMVIRYTHVWRKESGTWRLDVRHASIPTSDPGAR